MYAHVVSSGEKPEGLSACYSVTVHAAGRHLTTDNESGEDSPETSLQDYEQGDIFFEMLVSRFMAMLYEVNVSGTNSDVLLLQAS